MLALTPAEVLVGVSIAVGVIAILGALVRGLRTLAQRLDQATEAYVWVRSQLETNGAAQRAGTQGQTLRDSTDEMRIVLDAALTEMSQSISALNQRLDLIVEGMIEGGRQTGDRLAAIDMRIADVERRQTAFSSRMDRFHKLMRDHNHER